jgi:hypothetical protein
MVDFSAVGDIYFVIPAKAGIQGKRRALALGPCFRRDDDGKMTG